MSKIAILHDRFMSVGGGEFVAQELSNLFNAPIYTAYFDNSLTEYFNVHPIEIGSKRLKRTPIGTALSTFDFEQLDLSDYDIIISSGLLSRAYIPSADQITINYIHSPGRWLYDLHSFRIRKIPSIVRPLVSVYAQWWRQWDLTVNNYIDYYIANSELIQSRIKRYLGRESQVIYPPIDTGKYHNECDDGFYLFLSRLDHEKRALETIQACIDLDVSLIVIGTGKLEKQCRKISKGHKINMLGNVSEQLKIELLSRCKGVIYPAINEDFGMVPIEALASGKPFLCTGGGYPAMLVNKFNCGFVNYNIDYLASSIKQFGRMEFDIEYLQKQSKQFDISEFKQKFKQLVGGVQ